MFLDLWHDFYRVCAVIAVCSIAANFLPAASKLDAIPKLKSLYCVFVDLVAGFGGNWRADLPSLAMEFMGFRRKVRHGIRNWKQSRLDKR